MLGGWIKPKYADDPGAGGGGCDSHIEYRCRTLVCTIAGTHRNVREIKKYDCSGTLIKTDTDCKC